MILSELGMHLSGLERGLAARDARSALAAVRSLAGVGRHEEALRTADEARFRWPRAAGRLVAAAASTRDRRLLPMLEPFPVMRAAVLADLGDAESALAALDAAGSATQADRLLLRASVLRRLQRHDEAQSCLDQLFDLQGLRRVRFDPLCGGVQGLRCDPATSTDRTLISVVMPVKDVERHLEPALASVLAQDHACLEVIVVDDCSNDGTAGLAEAAARRDARVRVLRRAVTGGPYAARNQGLSQANGEIVTFHDGDDWSHPQKLSVQLATLRSNPDAIACLSDWARMPDDGSFCARQVYPLQRMNTSSLMFRRGPVLQRAGCFDAVLAGADSEFGARLELLFGAGSLVRVRRLLSMASCRPESLMHAPATGYGSPAGTLQRLEYWEAWNRWHAQAFGARTESSLRLAGKSRPFPVPSGLLPFCDTRAAKLPA